MNLLPSAPIRFGTTVFTGKTEDFLASFKELKDWMLVEETDIKKINKHRGPKEQLHPQPLSNHILIQPSGDSVTLTLTGGSKIEDFFAQRLVKQLDYDDTHPEKKPDRQFTHIASDTLPLNYLQKTFCHWSPEEKAAT